jgi:hypothetical protein
MPERPRLLFWLLAGSLALGVGLVWLPVASPIPPCCLRRGLASAWGALRPAALLALPMLSFFRRGFRG